MSVGSPGKGNEGPDFIKDTFDLFNFFAFAARVIAAPAEAWLRKPGTVGERYWNVSGPIGLVAFPMLCCLIGSACPMPLEFVGIVGFWFGTVGMLLVHRIRRVHLHRQGYFWHSMYIGDSWFDPKNQRDRLPVRTRHEVTAVVVAAFLSVPISFGLCGTLFIVAFALTLNSEMLRMQEAARLRSMQDAYLDARHAAERMRTRMYG